MTTPEHSSDAQTRDYASTPLLGDADAASNVDLGFLGPALQAGELGRLGPYRVLKILGKGGMGLVFLAEDTKLQRQVALKAMLPRFASDADARHRFLREARIAAQIEHDHIVHIYQVDEDRGVPFLAMQLLVGSNLDGILKRAGRLALPMAVRIGLQVAEALAFAHSRGLIHRDIKPANIWIEANNGGRVKLLDFGLARSVRADAGLTQSGVILGTPAYMPPEQARGEPVDHRCDLYALGCVLYRMTTGQMAVRGNDLMAVLMALANEIPTAPRKINSEIPDALNDLIVSLMAKNAADRPDSAAKVVQALRQVERELGGSADLSEQLSALATESAVKGPDDDGVETAQSHQTRRQAQRASVRRIPAAFLVVAAIVVGLALVAWWSPWKKVGNAVPPATPPNTDTNEVCLQFDGKSSYIEVESLIFDTEQPRTLEAWVTLDQDQAGPLLVRIPGKSWMGLSAAGNQWGVMALVNGVQQTVVAPGTVVQGVRTHVAGSWDGTALRLFVNGKEYAQKLESTQKPSQVESGKAGFAQIGGAPGTTTFLAGKIHGLRVSNIARYRREFDPPLLFTSDASTQALYLFGEGQGDRLTDSSGHGLHGKIIGARWIRLDGQTHPDSNAGSVREKRWGLRFGGENDIVDCPPIRRPPNEPITIESWLKIVGDTGGGAIVTMAHSGTGFSLYYARNQSIGFGLHQSHGTTNVTLLLDPIPTFTHVAAVWDGTTQRLYVNGKRVGNVYSDQGKAGPGSFLYIGKTPGRAGSIPAIIRAVRISKAARYVNDFEPDVMLAADSNTALLYDFSDGQGTKLTDSSGHGRHGTITGAKWVEIKP